MTRLRARFPVLKWVSGSGEFTGSWSEQQADFSFVQSQKTYPTDVKPAETRRNEKPDDCATPFEIHNHLSTTQQGNWLAGQTRPDLNCQINLAQQYMPSCTVGQIRMGSPSSSVLVHSTRAASIRDTH